MAFICFYDSSYLLLLFLEFHCGACVVCKKQFRLPLGMKPAVWEKLANSQRMIQLMHDACTLTLTLEVHRTEATTAEFQAARRDLNPWKPTVWLSLENWQRWCVFRWPEEIALSRGGAVDPRHSPPQLLHRPEILTASPHFYQITTGRLGCSATRTQLVSTFVRNLSFLHFISVGVGIVELCMLF